jgi:flagellar biosynthesis/type III secretory pathway protein FliH
MTLHELKRLQAFLEMDKPTQKAFQLGYEEGYEEGFQTAQVAERGIAKVQEKIDLNADNLFESVGIICKDYNDKILKK